MEKEVLVLVSEGLSSELIKERKRRRDTYSTTIDGCRGHLAISILNNLMASHLSVVLNIGLSFFCLDTPISIEESGRSGVLLEFVKYATEVNGMYMFI